MKPLSNPIHPNAEDTRTFWGEKLAIKDRSDIAIINHRFYVIGEAMAKFKGFYGKKFKILFQDGRVVETDNLWNGEPIPEEYQEQLPDNAEFLPVGPAVDPNSL